MKLSPHSIYNPISLVGEKWQETVNKKKCLGRIVPALSPACFEAAGFKRNGVVELALSSIENG